MRFDRRATRRLACRNRFRLPRVDFGSALIGLLATILSLALATVAAAQGSGSVGAVSLSPFVIGLRPVVSGGAVGGVRIDAAGVVGQAEVDALGHLRAARLEALDELSADVNRQSPLRKLSLRRLERAIAECAEQGVLAPDELQFLAGLQRIRYVFVYPDEHDLVLAGPAEGWQVDEAGNVVGISTGRPVLLLEDLVVALRAAEPAAQGGIACSIDPTSEGLRLLQDAVAHLDSQVPDAATINSLEQALGPQTITVRGVPPASHFARVLVAADYRMKRLAMNLDPAPVRGLPSYLQLSKTSSRGIQALLPRWWLAASYEPLLTNAEGLAWELRGPGVKAMSEEDLLTADGSRKPTGKTSAVARKWAENMTAAYDELSIKVPIFGELRNVMDLAVVAALIAKEGLAVKAGCNLPLLMGLGDLELAAWEVPRSVDSKASFVKKGRNWVVGVSGGIEVDSWSVVERIETNQSLSDIQSQSAPHGERWWWD